MRRRCSPPDVRDVFNAVVAAAGHGARAEDQKTPTPEPGATAQESCIDETEGYETHGRVITYVITLTNKCDKRMRCEVFAYH